MTTEFKLYFGLTTKTGKPIEELTLGVWLDVQLKRHGIEGATLQNARGYWRGQLENVLILSIVTDSDLSSIFRLIATIYANDFQQECVMFTKTDVSVQFVS